MKLSVSELLPGQEKMWNRVMELGNGGTIFHSLDFLAYHGDRFLKNERHLVFHNMQTLFGIMPLAIFDEDRKRIARSPYGASYGGPIFDRVLSYSESMKAVSELVEYFHRTQIDMCKITLPIQPCYRKFSETFLLALLENSFVCINQDISSVVSLISDDLAGEMDKRARNMARKADKSNISIVRNGALNDFWEVLTRTYAKLESKPTHSYEEFRWLLEHFPNKIYVDVAYLGDIPVAGIGHFIINDRVNSSFYLCQDPEWQQLQALSLLIYHSLLKSQQDGYTWFDFGTSSINMKGRPNLFMFKESFGAVGYFRNTYIWKGNS
jgi:hypothetical protein